MYYIQLHHKESNRTKQNRDSFDYTPLCLTKTIYQTTVQVTYTYYIKWPIHYLLYIYLYIYVYKPTMRMKISNQFAPFLRLFRGKFDWVSSNASYLSRWIPRRSIRTSVSANGTSTLLYSIIIVGGGPRGPPPPAEWSREWTLMTNKEQNAKLTLESFNCFKHLKHSKHLNRSNDH
eukprot:COSAG06_NODE_14792_length_1125_cov_2.192982_1_plen_176_part_00